MRSFFILTVITALVSSVVASSHVNNRNTPVLEKRNRGFHSCGHIKITGSQVKKTFKAGCKKLKEYLSGTPGSSPPIEMGMTENQIMMYAELIETTRNDPKRTVYAAILMDKGSCQRLSLVYRIVGDGDNFHNCEI
ncbi:hypothetical protein K3495_g3775 [Podosphaera aphanis]|nr:hypothetical protein K3495_g3775 [Podosphaera aphanis]